MVLQEMIDALNSNEENVLDHSLHDLNRTLREAGSYSGFNLRLPDAGRDEDTATPAWFDDHTNAAGRRGATGAATIRQHSEMSLWLLNKTRILPCRLHDDLRIDDHLLFSLIMDSDALKLSRGNLS